MTIHVAHIYASDAIKNSGDFLIGIATKKYFKEKILQIDDNIIFEDINCRQIFDIELINSLNNFDYIIIGAGGLILPDTFSNTVSCWQLGIPTYMYNKILKPIYVISIGFNLFYDQTINMYERESNISDISRQQIFKDNIIELIKISKYFTMRHNEDINQLIQIIGSEYNDKIKLELCPTIWYSNQIKKSFNINNKKYIAIEIKDDREWRRYYNISKTEFYSELEKVVLYCLENNIDIAYLSHDGSKNFYNYLKSKNINIFYIDNSIADENKIYNNYELIKTLICSAGHSQMIGYAFAVLTNVYDGIMTSSLLFIFINIAIISNECVHDVVNNV